jgi:hypothetical protein
VDDIQKYISCMEEIKNRTSVINSFLKQEKTTGFLITDVEFLCLQFRKIFELIVFASMTANREEYAKLREKFATDWKVDYIIRDLERINPSFYPVPSKQVIGEDGKVKEVVELKEGYLTKEKLLKAHEKCGGLLHANNPYRGSKDLNYFIQNFPIWLTEIINLLNHHQVQLTDSKKQLWVIMQANMDGRVHVYQMEKIEIRE